MFPAFANLPKWQRILLLVAGVAMLVHMGLTAHRRTEQIGDFDVHRAFGARFLDGAYLYENGECFNYMPISALYYSPLALVHPSVGTVARYLAAVVCLWLTLRMLYLMVRERAPGCREHAFAIATATVVLGLHYVIRDLDDGGPHLILLAMLVGGVYCVWQGRQLLGATWFGLAIALKMTPGLFLPFFVWKRQWRLACYTTLATAGWIALPALWMGPASWWAHQQEWHRVAFSVLADEGGDPMRDANELRVQNQSLKLAVMRYLVDYPDDHPLHLAHAGFVSFFDVDLHTAGRIGTVAAIALLAFCCWRARKPYRDERDPDWLVETSGVLLLTVLLSPVTWLQHMVVALPAIYVLAAEHLGIRRLPRPALALVGLYCLFSLVLNRELLGRENYLLLLSYQMHTGCMVLLLGLLLWLRPTARFATNSPLPAHILSGPHTTRTIATPPTRSSTRA